MYYFHFTALTFICKKVNLESQAHKNMRREFFIFSYFKNGTSLTGLFHMAHFSLSWSGRGKMIAPKSLKIMNKN